MSKKKVTIWRVDYIKSVITAEQLIELFRFKNKVNYESLQKFYPKYCLN